MKSRLVFLTGASSGIGLAMADFARNSGAVVATCSRSVSPDSRHLSADLSRVDSGPAVADWIASNIGEQVWDQIVFVHCAATISPIGPAGTLDAEQLAQSMVLNGVSPVVVGGAFLAAVNTHCGPDQDARLIQISSGAAKKPFPGWSGYCAAKAGLDMWVRTVGAELQEAGSKSKVLSIGPGVVATAMQATIRDSSAEEFSQVEHFRSMHSDGALASPDEVGAKLFAISIGDAWDGGDVVDVRDFD